MLVLTPAEEVVAHEVLESTPAEEVVLPLVLTPAEEVVAREVVEPTPAEEVAPHKVGLRGVRPAEVLDPANTEVLVDEDVLELTPAEEVVAREVLEVTPAEEVALRRVGHREVGHADVLEAEGVAAMCRRQVELHDRAVANAGLEVEVKTGAATCPQGGHAAARCHRRGSGPPLPHPPSAVDTAPTAFHDDQVASWWMPAIGER
mmetsp:Transcript_41862/g.130308  ORF Transcript_41862/g.130308 Transcript_41862/m.130308 type:complete len:204 (+) Transcript_41862:326-937(+)